MDHVKNGHFREESQKYMRSFEEKKDENELAFVDVGNFEHGPHRAPSSPNLPLRSCL